MQPGRPTRTDLLLVLLLELATVAHWLPRLRGPIDLRYDAGVYYVLGTSLAEGKGYRLLNEPGEIQAIQYPPLLPAWVALHERVLGTSDPLVVGQALRWSSLVLALAYAACAYALARRLFEARWAFFAALLAALYFHTLYLEDLLFAEVPFALLVLAFFLAHGSARGRVWTGPLAVAAFLLRTAGVALFAAWSLEALLARRWRALALRAALGALCVLGWQAYVWSVTSSPEYARPAYAYQRAPYQFYNVSYAENVALSDPFTPEEGRVTPAVLARRVVDQVPRLVKGVGESVSAPAGFWEWPIKSFDRATGASIPRGVVKLPLGLLGLAVLAGLFLLARAGTLALPLFVLCTLGLVALLPWPAQIPRYLAPLTPLLALGLTRVAVELQQRWRPAARALVAGLLCVQAFTLWKTFTVYHHRLDYPRAGAEPVHGTLFLFTEGPEWRRFYEALWWLRAHTAPEAFVATSCPHLAWIHAGRRAVMPPLEADAAHAQSLLDSANIDYLVVDDLSFVDISRRYAQPVLEQHPELWELVYRDEAGKVSIHRRR